MTQPLEDSAEELNVFHDLNKEICTNSSTSRSSTKQQKTRNQIKRLNSPFSQFKSQCQHVASFSQLLASVRLLIFSLISSIWLEFMPLIFRNEGYFHQSRKLSKRELIECWSKKARSFLVLMFFCGFCICLTFYYTKTKDESH